MPVDPILSFGAYRLDPRNARLWRGKQIVKLTGKALALLHYLVDRPGQLVTKDELFRAVWPQTVVSDAALLSCIQELRRGLRDKVKAARYIETVHGRGYRFIAAVQSSRFQVQSSKSPPAPNPQHPAPILVGRETELTQLHGWLEKALSSERQIVFITGEPGIGKTTLVEAFLAQVAGEGTACIGCGQCIEHYGVGEAYLPPAGSLGTAVPGARR